jgi:hypothetical protein
MRQLDLQDKEGWDNLDKARESYEENRPEVDPTITVKVVGAATRIEAGPKGSDLAKERAEYVFNQLRMRGVDPMRIFKGVEKEPSDSALGKVTILIQP